MEVAPLAQPIVPTRRTPNPVVDNVIHSGEIAPRSMIIRTTAQNIPVERAVAEPPAPRRRLGWLWLVAAIVPALAVVILTLAPPKLGRVELPTTDVAAVAELVGSTFDDAARAAQVRAETIASSSMLRAGIETDAQTLDDMTKDKDVVFPIAANESLEVIQLRNGASTPLLRLPKTAAELPPPPANGARLEVHSKVPTVVVAAKVSTQSNQVGGQLVLAAAVDLARIKTHVPARALSMSITGLGAPIELGGTPNQPEGDKISLPIKTGVAAANLQLVAVLAAAPPEQMPTWYRTARGLGAAVALLFVVLFLVSLLMRRPANA